MSTPQPRRSAMRTTTLINGETVETSSEAWRLECLQRHRHVENMRRLSLYPRRDYLVNVGRTEGAEAERRLRDTFLGDWEERKGTQA